MAHKILFIAPLPPPVHGSAMVSQYIKESRVVNEAFDCDFVNLSTSRSMEEIGKGGIKKLFRFVAAYFEVLWKLITHRYDLCYLAITCHGMGFLKDAPFVLLCKLFGRKVVLHQHNKGLSRDVERWPYRWLMPLVYRNTTVMLLSWHLYEDISAVVKREQVVVCANGIPEPHPNPLQKRGDSGHPGCSQISHTETKFAGRREKQFTEDTESTTLRPCCLRDETSNLTQTTQNTQNLHDASPVPSGVIACSDHELHGLHEYSGASATISHTESTESTEGTMLRPCCRPDGTVDCRPLTVDSNSLTVDTITDGEAPRLLFLSNLIESPGIYVLLEECRMLKEEGIVFQCDYVGGESKLISGESFRNAIAERGLTDCVTYHGPQYGAAKDRFFRGADIFVQPTFDDCFPLTLVEAMQYRLPIVSTDVGAIPDIVTDGVNGFVCPQRDVDALAVALRKLIGDRQLRVAMGQRGYELYRERMTLEVFEMRFTGLLKGIVGNG